MVITICQILKDSPQGTIKHDLSEELLSEKLYGEQLEMHRCFFRKFDTEDTQARRPNNKIKPKSLFEIRMTDHQED